MTGARSIKRQMKKRQTSNMQKSNYYPGMTVKNGKLIAPPIVQAELYNEMARRLVKIDYLMQFPRLIDKLIAFINGAALAGSTENLKRILFGKRHVGGGEYDRIGELAGLYMDAVSNWRAVDKPNAEWLEQSLGPHVNRYLSAMQHLKEGADNGDELRSLAEQEPMIQTMAEIEQLTRPGRPEYPETKILRRMKAQLMPTYAGQWVKMGRRIVDWLKELEQSGEISDLEVAALRYFEPLSNDQRKEILKGL